MPGIRRMGIAAARFAARFLALSTASFVCALPAQAWTYKTLYQFTGGEDGYFASGELLRNPATGDLYGVTGEGGDLNCYSKGCGLIFKLSSGGHLTVLHAFSKLEDGLFPTGGLVTDDAGNLYGTTINGGINGCLDNELGCGTVYRLAPDGSFSVLHRFNADTDGADYPERRLVRDPVMGDLLGAAYGADGENSSGGTIYRVTAGGKFKLLSAEPDYQPNALVRDSRGNLYGTIWRYTLQAKCQCGSVFELSHKGGYELSYAFRHKALGYPSDSALTLDGSGNLYGTNMGNRCCVQGHMGDVFRLSPGGKLETLYLFDGSDGATPDGNVVLDNSGTLFGTTRGGGNTGHGVIYQLNPDGTEQVLYNFGSNDFPPQGLIADENGNLYGTTYNTVYELAK